MAVGLAVFAARDVNSVAPFGVVLKDELVAAVAAGDDDRLAEVIGKFQVCHNIIFLTMTNGNFFIGS